MTELPPTDVVPESSELGPGLGAPEFDDDDDSKHQDAACDSPDRHGGPRGRELGGDSAPLRVCRGPEVVLLRSRLKVSSYEAIERRLVDIWHRHDSDWEDDRG